MSLSEVSQRYLRMRIIFITGLLLFLILRLNAQSVAVDSLKNQNSDSTTQFISLNADLIDVPVAQGKSLGQKVGRGFLCSVVLDATMLGSLLVMPESVSKWSPDTKFDRDRIRNQYTSTFVNPPHIDHDLWMINYVGHPYQGSIYYNSLRSQGATIVQSSVFSLGQSLIWEYLIEGAMEQPSVQDLFVTPILGTLLGELSHRATLQMKKEGFRWYEKIATCVINPTYVVNNGFKIRKTNL